MEAGDEASVTRAEWQPVPPRSGAALTVRDLWKDYTIGAGRKRTKLHALRGVDLDIAEGDSVALVGESGCGKSTLLRVIAGLATADRGSVEVGPGARPQMVFQDAGASLTPWLTVGELVGDRLRNDNGPGRAIGRHGISARVADTLRQVGLPPDIAHARAAQLSGGQRQRAAMARAIIVPPEVLLCDEPISALDVSLAATVLNLIGTLRRQLGLAVLFVTHDLAAARIVADRVAVMYLGQIVETGPAEEVCANPAHPYTRALFGAVPGQEHAQLAGEPASPLSPPSGCAFHPRCPVAVSSCATTSQTLAPYRGSAGRWVACAVAGGQAGERADGGR